MRRFYFDTEPLRHGNWPFKATWFGLGYFLRMASTMGAELYVPDPALHERAEQWVRETLAALSETSTKAKAARKALKPVGLEVTLQLPTEELLRAKYTGAEQAALKEDCLQRSPFPTRPLDEIFRMAVAREFTFEEKKDGVVGLQDCVILFSVLDHLKANPASAAFVSNDGIFAKIPALTAAGTDLRLIRGVTELEKILDDAVMPSFDVEFDQMWQYLTTRITALLNEHREEIQRFIERNITPAELEKVFADRVISSGPLAIERFGAIHPEMKGGADDPLLFSCDVTVSYTANVEERLERLITLASLMGSPSAAELSQFGSQVVSRERSAIVELSAQVNPDYTNLQLNAARIRA